MLKTIFSNFLGKTPLWYKYTILGFLIVNPLANYFISPFVAGWMVLIEFIFTLALALQAYPVAAGGLLALQAAVLGLASTDTIYNEIAANLPTLLLLTFMVAAIYYVKDVLSLLFTKIFLMFHKKWQVALAYCMVTAFTSSFFDALTVLAVLIIVCFYFLGIYYRAINADPKDYKTLDSAEVEEFRGYLRNLIMHCAVGTAMGGTLTLVGEPQNLMIGSKMGWSFAEFFLHCGIIAVPVVISGFLLCPILEITRFPGFGYQLPDRIRKLIAEDYAEKAKQASGQSTYKYILQGIVSVLLVLALGFHWAAVGLIGLAIIVVIGAFTGMVEEHEFAEAFNHCMPFVTLITIFFAILGVVHDQHLVPPAVNWVFSSFEGPMQLLVLYIINGAISMVSDSVFVAAVFIAEVENAYKAGAFNLEWYQFLATVVNMGTNIPSLGTPNGTAGFLFLLTSALSPVIKLSYLRMFLLMLPYFIVLSGVGGIVIYCFMPYYKFF